MRCLVWQSSSHEVLKIESRNSGDEIMAWFMNWQWHTLILKVNGVYVQFIEVATSGNCRFRIMCKKLVERKWFDNAILLFIALNCITLAMERPNIPPSSTERIFLSTANYIFTVVFAVEMFVKVVYQCKNWIFEYDVFLWKERGGYLMKLSVS